VLKFPHGRVATSESQSRLRAQRTHPEIAERVAAIVTRAGIDACATTRRSQAGYNHRHGRLLGGLRSEDAVVARSAWPTIVLSHNPDTVDEPRWGSYRGWIFGPHARRTCKPPFPAPLLPVKNKRYVRGFVPGNRRLYISQASGTDPPAFQRPARSDDVPSVAGR
jgi:hypothetical protein